MTTARTTLSRRLTGSALALFAGTGILLTPAVAQASAAAPTAATATAAPAPTAAAQQAVDTAMAQQGKPYSYGAAGPDSFDCSGLTQYAWGSAGVSLPHSSSQQSQLGTPVDRASLQPGDLVFFYSPVSHVGIYIGNNQVVHAPTEGDVVKVSDIDAIGNYNSARRVG
ncbi:C40 family peptidase [Petropleomorpha daqingensis]|uniref:Cell wall-associated NlpC family hydrolase n=1 Tax=Petropleomorpha daqingensis TaxID=2026353 RepID=A0A853C972_9ACTN|nr:C40 family peptidase [Petropleomorpha daqingensis]NYJ03857.1 cell wall-associated NlpC family hydrolase [Petropleomorpha daqingensis]